MKQEEVDPLEQMEPSLDGPSRPAQLRRVAPGKTAEGHRPSAFAGEDVVLFVSVCLSKFYHMSSLV